MKIEEHTPDWLRSFSGCEKYSDAEAREILNGLDTLSEVLLTTIEKIIHIENQVIVSSTKDNLIKKLAA